MLTAKSSSSRLVVTNTFCEIDADYVTDRFNLTGLNTDVQCYQYALDLVSDVFDMRVDNDMREQIEKSARHLYGPVHARYVVTTRGLAKMVRHVIACSQLDRRHHADQVTDGKVQTWRFWQVPKPNMRVAASTTNGPI